ncbi:metal-dependent phosphohydrolase [Pseudodesulfovibrio sp.]|uniref:metal-dependent phosphohydrolase n=1 Tax=unclassified Pseudodesulfovibrio TaxID=2661612 RepID=UPI003AFF97A0
MSKDIYLCIKDEHAVDQEVHDIVSSIYPDFDFTVYEKAFDYIQRLFSGQIDGFEACDTPYHDWMHTLGVLVTTARLLHGVHVGRHRLPERVISLCLTAALFHDAGYIRRSDEPGPGGRFTSSHVERGVDLLEAYVDDNGIDMGEFLDMESMLLCTDTNLSPDSIVFSNFDTMLAGHVLGTSDVLAQMANDIYLEKLPLLFQEFNEAGMKEYSSEYELFMRTLGFYSFMRSKMRNHLSNVAESMIIHFKTRYGVERDFYAEAVERNIEYLSGLLNEHGEHYAKGLRRRMNRKGHPVSSAA